jgi:hypothetical protein
MTTTKIKVPDGAFKATLADGRVLVVEQDQCGFDPRKEFDNLGTIVAWHNRYDLGDRQPDGCPDEFLANLVAEATGEAPDEDLQGQALLEEARKHAIILPLFLYDHSGLALATTPFHCPWDSGQVGWIYLTYARLEDEYKEINVQNIACATEVLEGEVRVYNHYLGGAVFGFSLQQPQECEACGHRTAEVLDSCGGFFGFDHWDSGLIEAVLDADTDLTREQIEDAEFEEAV